MEKHPDRSHGNQIFSDEFESALTAFLEARSMISQPMTPTDFISYVTKTCAEIYGPSEWSAASWYPGFMACHQNQVLVRNTKAISKSRKNPITYESIKLWNEAYPAYMKEKGYSSTTHFLQPLDAAPFANLKNKIWRLYNQKKSFTTEHPTDKAVNLLLKVFDTMKTASGVENSKQPSQAKEDKAEERWLAKEAKENKTVAILSSKSFELPHRTAPSDPQLRLSTPQYAPNHQQIRSQYAPVNNSSKKEHVLLHTKRHTINRLDSAFGNKKVELKSNAEITNMENLLQGLNDTAQEIEFKGTKSYPLAEGAPVAFLTGAAPNHGDKRKDEAAVAVKVDQGGRPNIWNRNNHWNGQNYGYNGYNGFNGSYNVNGYGDFNGQQGPSRGNSRGTRARGIHGTRGMHRQPKPSIENMNLYTSTFQQKHIKFTIPNEEPPAHQPTRLEDQTISKIQQSTPLRKMRLQLPERRRPVKLSRKTPAALPNGSPAPNGCCALIAKRTAFVFNAKGSIGMLSMTMYPPVKLIEQTISISSLAALSFFYLFTSI
ncbi:hypothetical protein BCR33DRAFT_785728 [Rhizoclosmatium globosum]|uniref:Uncharacterized protein n=1 Tax=Rhizoclosmatium globosum TaxID=329046 RepID=A0A1Y2C8K9_9FUNG|nr:hypothetical protein BCR33DRAFT_785728 [Rhizoclosmatium globosum]|eukprot:ORY43352.1 hypothetical protein BCR33DRAFT_785728 [Rhizoclosmatium globosum]